MEALTEVQAVEEIPALLVPVLGMTVLLPTVSVAEMVPFRKTRFLARTETELGFWGHYEWRDQKVPLLCFEKVNGLAASALEDYRQVAIIHATGVNKETAYIAVLAQGIPHVARVKAETIDQNTAASKLPYSTLSVLVDGREAEIPDVAKLEIWLAELGAQPE